VSSRVPSKNLKIKLYKPLHLYAVLYGCETWSLTLREEHRLKVFENRVMWRIFEPKMKEVGEGCIIRNFITFKLHQLLLG
jgi:hypothetical protein